MTDPSDSADSDSVAAAGTSGEEEPILKNDHDNSGPSKRNLSEEECEPEEPVKKKKRKRVNSSKPIYICFCSWSILSN